MRVAAALLVFASLASGSAWAAEGARVSAQLRFLLSQASQCTAAAQDKCSDDQQACLRRAGGGTSRGECCPAYLACLDKSSCNTGNLRCN